MARSAKLLVNEITRLKDEETNQNTFDSTVIPGVCGVGPIQGVNNLGEALNFDVSPPELVVQYDGWFVYKCGDPTEPITKSYNFHEIITVIKLEDVQKYGTPLINVDLTTGPQSFNETTKAITLPVKIEYTINNVIKTIIADVTVND